MSDTGTLISENRSSRKRDPGTLYVDLKFILLMRSLNEKGQKRHLILQSHFVGREHEIGGFSKSR